MHLSKHRLTPFTAGFYRICAQGKLDASWSEQLGAMRLVVEERQTGPVVVLTGMLVDQAALLGVLNQLYLLGLALISVEYLADSDDSVFFAGSQD